VKVHDFEDVRGGFELEADAVVVGSGAGGAVAAKNLADAGLHTVVLEAGPRIAPADMSRDAPRFLARYFWEGGLRMIGGTGQVPSLQGRCLGGSTVVNSAIMLPLPHWVREAWSAESGYECFLSEALDRAYARVFARLSVAPTPLAVLGRRSLIVRDALKAAGLPGKPLPRAVVNCEGCSDCVTGCANGHKQSVDRTYLVDAAAAGAEIFTHATVESVLTSGGRATGVSGSIVEQGSYRRVARFKVHAPRVVMAAGALHTPVILQRSGLDAKRTVGSTFFAHIGGGIVGVMDEVVDPWVGATQGWGAISEEIPGMKYECLWAAPSVLMVRWGDVGRPFQARLSEVKHATVIAVVYRGRVRGDVRATRSGAARARVFIPDDEARVVLRGMKIAADALLAVGARYTHTGIPGAVDEMHSRKDTASLLNPRLGARDLQMTMNHVFGSCRMSRDGAVDEHAALRGVKGVYLMDASVFPSPSAVNPQATIMALSDINSRRLAEFAPD
jgi:choline dehydrogenase-like flavoprotein